MKNSNLSRAKAEKNDEFYTRLEDIEIELSHYPEKYFRNKIIYLPCDVAIEGDKVPKSNFVKYFQINRVRLGYKKLIATSINNKKNLYILDKEGKEFYEHCPEDSEYVSGDYRSEYCQKLFKEADVVVTNPPFSLFRDFVACLEKHDLKYCIVGNMNAITSKDIFPLIKDNKLWYGGSIHSGDRKFSVPENYSLDAAGCGIDKDGKRYIQVKGVRWFTNMDYPKRHEDLILTKKYNAEDYPKYDNYDAINVNKYAEIPCDYDGVMGVPITILDFYNPTQFEIVGISGALAQSVIIDGHKKSGRFYLNGKRMYDRIVIRRKQQEVQ